MSHPDSFSLRAEGAAPIRLDLTAADDSLSPRGTCRRTPCRSQWEVVVVVVVAAVVIMKVVIMKVVEGSQAELGNLHWGRELGFEK